MSFSPKEINFDVCEGQNHPQLLEEAGETCPGAENYTTIGVFRFQSRHKMRSLEFPEAIFSKVEVESSFYISNLLKKQSNDSDIAATVGFVPISAGSEISLDTENSENSDPFMCVGFVFCSNIIDDCPESSAIVCNTFNVAFSLVPISALRLEADPKDLQPLLQEWQPQFARWCSDIVLNNIPFGQLFSTEMVKSRGKFHKAQQIIAREPSSRLTAMAAKKRIFEGHPAQNIAKKTKKATNPGGFDGTKAAASASQFSILSKQIAEQTVQPSGIKKSLAAITKNIADLKSVAFGMKNLVPSIPNEQGESLSMRNQRRVVAPKMQPVENELQCNFNPLLVV